VRQPIKDLSERAVHLLVENQTNGSVHYDALPFELIVRESTSQAPRQGPA
jgi:DNA-binding LacI/PurR family transcriptional regulator